METELERLVVRLVGDASSYTKMLTQAQAATRSTSAGIGSGSAEVMRYTQALNNWSQGMVSNLMGIAGISAGFGSVMKGVQLAASFEENEVAFGTMLQDMEYGKQLLGDMAEFGAKTPLNLPDIQNAGKTLLQFGFAGEELIPTMRMLGDVVGGNAFKFQNIAVVMGQMRSQGKMMGNDMYQLINAGFNPLQETAEHLSKTLGGPVQQHLQTLRAKMEQGQFTFKMVKESFTRATSEGGKFFDLMAKQANSLGGLFSTMQDDIGAFLRTLGMMVVETFRLKDLMKGVSASFQAATEAIKAMPDWLKQSIVASGTLISSLVGLVGMWPYVRAAALPVLKVLLTAFKLFGGPVGWLITAVTTLGAVFVNQAGGIGNAWKMIQDAAMTAWSWITSAWGKLKEWLQPIGQALTSLLVTAWKKINEGAVWLWGQLVVGFNRIVEIASWAWEQLGGGEIDWNALRDGVRDAIIFAEFTLENLGLVANYVWAGIKYKAVEFGNTLVWVFTELVPAALKWLKDNFWSIHTAMMLFGGKVFEAMGENIATVWNAIPWTNMWNGFKDSAIAALGMVIAAFKDLPSLLAGRIDITDIITKSIDAGASLKNIGDSLIDPEEVGRDVARNMGAAIGKFTIPKREIGAMEAKLKEEYEKLGAEVGEEFNKFRDRKLKEWEAAGKISPEAANKMRKEGPPVVAQEQYNAATKAIQKFDATLMNSAEMYTRLQTYLDRIKKPFGAPGAPGENKAGGADAAGPNIPIGGRIEARPPQEPIGNAAGDALKNLQNLRRQRGEAVAMVDQAKWDLMQGEGSSDTLKQAMDAIKKIDEAIAKDEMMIEVLREIRDNLNRNPLVGVGAAGLPGL